MIQVQAKFSDFEPGWLDDLVLASKEIPAQKRAPTSVVPAAQLESTKAAASSAKQGTVVVMATNILTSGAMAQIWGMINGMQIYCNLPLFKVLFPSYTSSAIGEVVEISSFEVIPLGDLLTLVFGEPEGDGDEAIPDFYDNGYESYYIIINLGGLAVIFVMTITIPLLIILFLSPLKSRSKYAQNKIKTMTNAMHGNMMIRYVIEAGLDISISVSLQLYYADLNGGLFGSSSAFDVTNSLMTVIFGPVVLIGIVVLGFFYVKTFNRWSDEDYDNKYGAVFEGLRKDTKAALFYPLIFMVRRIAFSIVAIFTLEHLFLQIWCLFIFSTLQLVFLFAVKPFDIPLMQGLEVFNELCSVILIYVMMCFSDANNDLEYTANYYDFAFLFGMAVNLIVHVYLLVKDSVLSIKDKIKARCFKTKAVAKGPLI